MAHFYSRAPQKPKAEGRRRRVLGAPWQLFLSCFHPTAKSNVNNKSFQSRETIPIFHSETKHVVPPARQTTPISLSGTTIQAKPPATKPWKRRVKITKNRTSLGPKLPLLSFPNEILLAIAENLDLGDIKSLLLANRSLALLIMPTYQRHAMEYQGFQKSLDFPEVHWASWKGHVSLVRQLLDRGFDVNSRTKVHGTTPLHHAARWGHEAVVRLLLDRGADIDVQDTFDGKTPLHLARLEGRPDIIKILLGRGANIGIKDDAGRTALSYTYGSSNSDYHWRPRDSSRLKSIPWL